MGKRSRPLAWQGREVRVSWVLKHITSTSSQSYEESHRPPYGVRDLVGLLLLPH